MQVKEIFWLLDGTFWISVHDCLYMLLQVRVVHVRVFLKNISLVAPWALANRLQRRTTRKANKANLDPPNQKSEISSL